MKDLKMRFRQSRSLVWTLVLSVMLATGVNWIVQAQIGTAQTTPVTLQTLYPLVAISSTAAVNNQTTLTIPAPPAGWYNYVCSLTYHASQDGTATVQTNAVTTSTNFNSFALKYSLTATATINFDQQFNWGNPAVGCVKSASPTTATTFVGPTAGANIAQTWYATYYQAP